ncbi:hypothetical protein ADUPG1_005404, partial [Aduncisulcus paluster]
MKAKGAYGKDLLFEEWFYLIEMKGEIDALICWTTSQKLDLLGPRWMITDEEDDDWFMEDDMGEEKGG